MSDVSSLAFIIEDAEMIAELITRCAIFEKVYLKRISGSTFNLRQNLTKLYETIILYLSEARKFFGQNSVSMSLTNSKFQSISKRRRAHLEECNNRGGKV